MGAPPDVARVHSKKLHSTIARLWIGAVAVPTLLTAAVAFGAAATASRPDFRWLPAGTQLLVRVRFSDMRTSSLFKRLATSRPLFSEEMTHIDRFVSEAGLEIGRDIDTAWIATDGKDRGESVALLLGRLDREKIAARLSKQGSTPSEYAGTTLYTIPAQAAAAARRSTESHPAAASRGASSATVVAFSGDKAVIVGTRNWVTEAADRTNGRGETPPRPAPVSPLLRKLDESATIWSAAGSGAIATKIRSEWENSELAGDLEVIRTLVASFRVTNDVRIDSEAATASEEDASVLAVTLQGLIALGGLRATGSDPDLAEVLRGLRVERTQGGIRLTGQIPASFASRL